MNIIWRNVCDKDEELIESWCDQNDKKMLCMEEKSWQETAKDIEECLSFMKDGQFRNMIGYIENKPVCVLMFGVEFSGEVLRIYNIAVNPEVRNMGIAKQAMRDILSKDNVFNLNKTYKKIETSVFPENEKSINLWNSCDFKYLGKNDAYIDFSYDLNKEITK